MKGMPPLSEAAREAHGSALIVDLHCDLLLTSMFLGWDWSKRHRRNPLPGAALMGHVDLPRLEAGNVGCMALGVVTNPLLGPLGPRSVDKSFERMHRKLEQHGDRVELALTAQAIRAARARGRIACFAGLEGAHGLQGKLDALPDLKARGLGYVGLVHFSRNHACSPMVGWGQSQTRGLTPYGQDLVDELNRLRILIDVAHVGRAALLETCARTDAPLICSHTACNAIHNSPRGLDDTQLKAIADTGGVIGVIFVTPFIGPGGIPRVVEHLNHLKAVVGVQHCALGTDWEGFSLYPSDLDSVDKLPWLTQALLESGWSVDEIHALYGENFLRVIEAGVG